MNTNTLHLCHTDVIKDCDFYHDLIKTGDAVIFYGSDITTKKQQQLSQQFHAFDHHYLYDHCPSLSSINYDDWVTLVNQYSKTFSWK